MLAILLLSLVSFVAYGQHAKCYMKITVYNTTIKTLNDSIVKMVQTREGIPPNNQNTCVYSSQGAEFCGYSVVSISERDNHFQHETPVHKYVDDLNWLDWEQQKQDVVVQVDSESEPNSIGDYDTNFCNNFNLFRNGNAHQLNFQIKIEFTECTNSHHPDISKGWDAAYKQCDTY
eukprot:706388_1